MQSGDLRILLPLMLTSALACSGDDATPDGGGAPDSGMTADSGAAADAGGACLEPRTVCGSDCADLLSSAAHCGACNQACGGGETCRLGSCIATPTPIVAAVPAQVIGPGCTSGQAQADGLAVDDANTIYAAMLCGGDPQVAVSVDGGQTFGAPVSIGFADAVDVTVAASRAGVVHAMAHTMTGALVYARSADRGVTWSATRLIDGGPVDQGFVMLRANLIAWKDELYSASINTEGTRVKVYVNRDGGVGAFSQVEVERAGYGGNLQVDPRNGDVLLFADLFTNTVGFRSVDRGETFDPLFDLDDLGDGAEYAFHPPNVFSLCSIRHFEEGMPNTECATRLDLDVLESTEVLPPDGFTIYTSLGQGSVAALGDGSGVFALSRGASAPDRTGLAIGHLRAGETTIGEARVVSEAPGTMDRMENTLDLRAVPGTSAVIYMFTGAQGVRVGVELF